MKPFSIASIQGSTIGTMKWIGWRSGAGSPGRERQKRCVWQAGRPGDGGPISRSALKITGESRWSWRFSPTPGRSATTSMLCEHEFGAFRWNPTPSHRLILPLADKTILDMQVDFIALDGPTAEADLRGAELTGVWANEISEIPRNIITFALGRIGRFPAVKDGGPTWSGLIADSNAWDQDHWLHNLYTSPPDGWQFFRQPGAVQKINGRWTPNPAAENLQNLLAGYYERMLASQADDWTSVYLGNEFGFSIDGKVVYPEWSDSACRCWRTLTGGRTAAAYRARLRPDTCSGDRPEDGARPVADR